MSNYRPHPTPSEIAERRRRRLEGMKFQEIAGNPLTADEIAMFEMFEREGWSHEQCRAYILKLASHSQQRKQSDESLTPPPADGDPAPGS